MIALQTQGCVAEFEESGSFQFGGAVDASGIERLSGWAASRDSGQPGERVAGVKPLEWLLREGVASSLVRGLIGEEAKPVRAILFDKSSKINWALGWHQDRTIAVREKREVAGFGPWSIKAGVPHVEPPFELIERMITLRIHLDAVDEANAPLLVAPGSHRFGRVPEAEIGAVVDRCGRRQCLADTGDIWAYRTAILHASERSSSDRRRRVLQVDYSADQLPKSLEWQLD